MTISGDLDESLETTPVLPRDAVSVGLARRYAAALDDCFDALVEFEAAEDDAVHARVVLEITRLGGRLEAMLDRLGMAPSARPAVAGAGGTSGPSAAASAVEQLQRDRAAGAPTSGLDYATTVDPAVAEALAAD
jgi:hypothetical protein